MGWNRVVYALGKDERKVGAKGRRRGEKDRVG